MNAQYTVHLKTLLDNPGASAAIKAAMSDYPMYESTSKAEFIPRVVPTRDELNKKILDHYKYREIGFETVGRFLDELKISLHEIMPYYNQLFFTADQDYNIIFNVDYKRTIETDRDGSSSNTATGKTSSTSEAKSNNTTTSEDSSESKTEDNTTQNATTTENTSTTTTLSENDKSVHSATPQGQLSISAAGIDSVDYADDATWHQKNGQNTGNSNGTTTTSGNTTGSGSNTVKGNQTASQNGTTESTENGTTESTENGTTAEKEKTLETTKGNFGVVSAQDLIAKYREIILNIEQMIINDKRIAELFMLIF